MQGRTLSLAAKSSTATSLESNGNADFYMAVKTGLSIKKDIRFAFFNGHPGPEQEPSPLAVVFDSAAGVKSPYLTLQAAAHLPACRKT